MDRLAWNLKTLVEPYESAGFAGRAWDEPARQALSGFAHLRSGVPPTNASWPEIIAANCDRAVKAGCKDPMIEYLRIRFPLDHAHDHKAFADALCRVAIALQETSYPPIRKFYAARRASEQFYQAYDRNADRSLLQQVGGLSFYLRDILHDSTIPVEEAYEVGYETLEAYAGSRDRYEEVYRQIEKPMFDKWSDDYRSWLLKGQAYVRIAWIHRGGGYANTVTEKGWEGFYESLAVAEQALERAWELNQHDAQVPYRMLRVELGQGKGRDRLELWFNRAMTINTNFHEACASKLFYLEPKWHGSQEILLAFGRECVESTKWGGRVPLILLDAHIAIANYLEDDEKAAYWKRTDVWLDIQDAFERFFELNPDATGWYHNYAWYARRSERWNKVKELIPKLGPINYAYFGGRKEFDEMVRLAELNAAKTPPDVLGPEIELNRLNARIANKIDLGEKSEAEFAAELEALDELLARSRGATPDDHAAILITKAMLYLRVFEDWDQGKQLIARIQKDFPETKAAQAAGGILAMLTQQEESKKIQAALVAGKPFPDFAVRDLAGNPLSVSGHKGKVVLIDFWATWCGPCIAELPNLLAAYEKHHDQGFEIIGISLDQSKAKLESFLDERKMTWPQYFDGQGWGNVLAKQYGIASIPATFLLDREGTIVARDLRGDALQTAVAKALSAK